MKIMKWHPIFKIIIGLAICYLPILLFNLLILKPVFQYIEVVPEVERVIRFFVNSCVLLILFHLFMNWTEKEYAVNWRLSYIIREIGIGAGISVLIITIVILLIAVSGAYQINNFRFNFLASGYLLIVFAFMALLEEVLFRGIVFRILNQWLGTLIAVVLSGVLFSLPHLFNENGSWITFLAAAIGGAILAFLFVVSKQIWLSFGFHMFWNFTQVNFGSNLSGSDEFITYAILDGKFTGSPLITGGMAGIENSLYTICITLLFAIGLFWYSKKKNKTNKEVL